MTINQHVENWIQHLSQPQTAIGGMAVCPFARAANYRIIETQTIVLPDQDFDVVVYVLPDYYTETELTDLCTTLNSAHPDYIFLPDHRSRQTLINGVQTNNGLYNLVLCQSKDKLLKARDVLSKTNYYQYWSPEYFKEITGHDFY